MLTSDIESKLAIVKSKPTYKGSPERKNKIRMKDMIDYLNTFLCIWPTFGIVHPDSGSFGKLCDQRLN